MALFNCPDCQSKISDQSQHCIHCGFPLGKRNQERLSIEVLLKNDEKRAKNLIIRAQIYLEDGEYSKAEELIEKALELEPRGSETYIMKLLTTLQVSNEKEMIRRVKKPLTDYKDYNRAVEFATVHDLKTLQEYNQKVLERFEYEKNIKIYQTAQNLKAQSVVEEDYLEAARKFESISGHKDALELSKACRVKAEELKKEGLYQEAVEKMELGKIKDKEETSGLYIEASELFKILESYKDAKNLQKACESESLRLNQELIYEKGSKKKEEAHLEKEYKEAAALFYSISEYKNAGRLAEECEELGKKVSTDYLETLLKKRRRRKILKKSLKISMGVLFLVLFTLGVFTNFTYSQEVYVDLKLGREEYLWREVMEQIKDWFAYAGGSS